MASPVQPQSVNAPAAAPQNYAGQGISPSYNQAAGIPTQGAQQQTQQMPQGGSVQPQQIQQHPQGQQHMQSAPGVQGMPPQPQGGFATGAQRAFAAQQPAALPPNAALSAVIQPAPGIPPALVGRKVSEVIGMWNAMEQNVRQLTQPQQFAQQPFSPSAAVAPQQYGGAPVPPVPNGYPSANPYAQQRYGLPQPGSQANVQQQGAEYWQQQIQQTAQQAAQEAAQQAAAAMREQQLPQLVEQAWNNARQQLAGFDDISQEILQIAQTLSDKSLLADPRMWQLAYNQAIGERIGNGQPLPQAIVARLSGQQGAPAQQQNDPNAQQPQSMSASANGQYPNPLNPAQQAAGAQAPQAQPQPAQLPPGMNQLNVAQPYSPYSTGAMFTEAPQQPMYGQSAQLSPDEAHAAKMMNITPEQYMAWRQGGR